MTRRFISVAGFVALSISQILLEPNLFAQSPELAGRPRPSLEVGLSALAGGVRFFPDPGEHSYLYDRPAGLEPEPFPVAPREVSEKTPRKKQDRFQSFAVLLRSAREPEDQQAGNFFYRAELGVFFQEGGSGIGDQDSPERGQQPVPETRDENPRIYPGNDLFVALRAADGLELALGRKLSPERWRDELTGSHGPLTGFALSFKNESARLELTPYHRHSLAGHTLSDQKDPSRLQDVGRRQAADVRNLARGSDSFGARAAFTGQAGLFRVGLDYASNRQEETARLVGSGLIDRVDYAGAGIGLGADGPERAWNVYAHVERSLGFVRSQEKNLAGDRIDRIDGRALTTGGWFRSEIIFFSLRVFLPEPASLARAGNAGSTGYIGYGDAAPRSPILAGALDARPAPILCRDRARCDGIERNRELPGFADHAGVGELTLGLRAGSIQLDLDAALFRPLAARGDRHPDPFRRTRPDENGSLFSEIALGMGRTFPGGRLRLQYARLIQQRERTGATRLAGEALVFSMVYDL